MFNCIHLQFFFFFCEWEKQDLISTRGVLSISLYIPNTNEDIYLQDKKKPSKNQKLYPSGGGFRIFGIIMKNFFSQRSFADSV